MMDITWWCLADPPEFLATVHVELRYDESSDTLADSGDFLWHRR
jgi:hypothetical protein